jgi:dimethylargininase
MLTALTRDVSGAFHDCHLTHLDRVAIDVERARAQHDAYEWALVELGCTVRRIDTTDQMPDSVFIEDTAVVFREGAVIARPGAESRRAEVAGVAGALQRFGLPCGEIVDPGTLDGGDVLVVGRRVFVGESTRTNSDGIRQLKRLLQRLDYKVQGVPLRGCLHLKSAATLVAPDTLLINRAFTDDRVFSRLTLIDVDPDEPESANALLAGNVVIYPSAYPRTRRRLEARGIQIRSVDVDELAKGEGGVTCCSLLIET